MACSLVSFRSLIKSHIIRETLYRLLKESCEYLGEHSRKREEHSKKRDQQKNNREMQLAGAESKRGGRRDKVKEAGAQAAALSKMGRL